MCKGAIQMTMRLAAVFILLTFSTLACLRSKSESDQSSRAAPSLAKGEATQFTQASPDGQRSTAGWNAQIGGKSFSWNGADLAVTLTHGRKVEIFSQLAKNDYQELKREENTTGCLTDYHYRPLAVAGNVVSFEYESALSCGAINTASGGYGTIELTSDGSFLSYSPESRNGKPTRDPSDVSLLNVFSENDVYKSFLSNQRISEDIARLIHQRRISGEPANLAELRKLFAQFNHDFLDGRFYLDSQALEGFAIHHLEGDAKVSVWISLTPISRGEQALKDHLELILPIPEKLRLSLLKASSGEEGFLMVDAEKVVGTGFGTFEFHG